MPCWHRGRTIQHCEVSNETCEGRPRESVNATKRMVVGQAPRQLTVASQCYSERRAVRALFASIRFLLTAACSRQNCFDTLLGCESLRDDIQVRAVIGRKGNAHRARWASLFNKRHSKLASCEGRGARDADGSHTREQSFHIVNLLWQRLKPIFNVSSQNSLLLLRQIVERLEQELQGYANEFWTLLYQG